MEREVDGRKSPAEVGRYGDYICAPDKTTTETSDRSQS